MGFHKQLSGKFSKLTEFYHITSERTEFSSRVPKIVKYGTKTILFLAPNVWALTPGKIKECSCLKAFKFEIRKWKPDCPCRLSKTYLEHWFSLNMHIMHVMHKCTFSIWNYIQLFHIYIY